MTNEIIARMYDLHGKLIDELTESDTKMEIKITSSFTGIFEVVGCEKAWFKNGKYHREDGCAVEWLNTNFSWSDNPNRYYLNGNYVDCNDLQHFKLYVDLLKLKVLL